MPLILTFKFSVQVGKAPRCALQRSGKQCACRRALKQTPEWTCKLAVSTESCPENIKQQINERASVRKVDHSKWITFRYRTLRRVRVSRSVTCVRLLLRLSVHCNNIPCTVAHSLRACSGAEFLSSCRTHGRLPIFIHRPARRCPGLWILHPDHVSSYTAWACEHTVNDLRQFWGRGQRQREGGETDAAKKLSKSEGAEQPHCDWVENV